MMDTAAAAPDTSTQGQGPIAPNDDAWANSEPSPSPTPASPAPVQTEDAKSSATIPQQKKPDYQPAPVVITPQKRGGILGVVDSVMNALTGTTQPELAKGSDGNTYVKQTTLSHGQQWARLGEEALRGAGAGMAAGRGNNPGGALAAGVNQGTQIAQQRQQQGQQMSAEAQQENLANANNQMLQMNMAKAAWEFSRKQIEASQHDVEFANNLEDRLVKEGGRVLGTAAHPGDIADILKVQPDVMQQMVKNQTIKIVPNYDEDGKAAGIKAIMMPDSYHGEAVPAGQDFPTYNKLTHAYEWHKTSQPDTRGGVDGYWTQAATDKAKDDMARAQLEKEQAQTGEANANASKVPSEINRNNAEASGARARAALVPSEIAKNNAETSKANATNPGTAANQATIDDIGMGKIAVDRLGYLLAKNPELINAVTQKYPDFDSSKVGAYVAATKDFTNTKKGSTGAALNSGGTAMKHLAELDALNTPLSHIPGTPDHTAYMNKLGTVAPELAAFYGDATIPAIDSLKSTLGTTLPGSRYAAIREQVKSMGDKFDSYEQSWKNAAPSAQYSRPMPNVDDAAQKARAKLDPNYRARVVQGMQPQSQQPAAAAQASGPIQLQPGETPLVNPKTQQQIILRNGTWVDVKTGKPVQ